MKNFNITETIRSLGDNRTTLALKTFKAINLLAYNEICKINRDDRATPEEKLAKRGIWDNVMDLSISGLRYMGLADKPKAI